MYFTLPYTEDIKIKCLDDKYRVIYPGEQCVETVDLLPLCDVGVVLSNTLQS